MGGKRGPKPGTVYQRRVVIAGRLRIDTDGQLVAAQHFNDRLDRLMADIDCRDYPAAEMDESVIRRLMQELEVVQGAVIEGIEAYLRRCGMRRESRSSEALPDPGRKLDIRGMRTGLPAEDVFRDG